MQSADSKAVIREFQVFLKKVFKETNVVFGKIFSLLKPLLKSILKKFIKTVKRIVKFILSIRVGVRPEFKDWVKEFDIKEVIKNIKNFNFKEYVFKLSKSIFFVISSPDRWTGRLRISRKNRNRFTLVIGNLLPLLFAFLILRFVSPISAQLLGYEERLNAFLSDNNVTAGLKRDGENVNQVYFMFEDVETVITDSDNNKGEVDSKNEYITWMESVDGSWQIFLYHIPTQTKTQLTYAGNNVNSKVSGGKVVWEGIRAGSDWRVYLYDGASLGPISTGDPSFKPQIEGNFVVFSRKDVNNQWRSTAYSINDRESVDIDFGEDNKFVNLKNKDIFVGYSGRSKKFGLNVEDLMILNLGALSAGPSASIESIQKEIDALTGGT